jgi:hypothetical protein
VRLGQQIFFYLRKPVSASCHTKAGTAVPPRYHGCANDSNTTTFPMSYNTMYGAASTTAFRFCEDQQIVYCISALSSPSYAYFPGSHGYRVTLSSAQHSLILRLILTRARSSHANAYLKQNLQANYCFIHVYIYSKKVSAMGLFHASMSFKSLPRYSGNV